MIWAILGGLIVVALGAGVAVWLLRREPKEPDLSFSLAVSTAKQALQTKRPTLRIFNQAGERIPYDPKKDNRDRMQRLGKYQLGMDDVIITYTVEEYVEEVVVALAAFDEKVGLSYVEGEMNAAWIGSEALGQESFELRQGRNAASNLRRLLRRHLVLPGGELDTDDAPGPAADGQATPRKKKKRRPTE